MKLAVAALAVASLMVASAPPPAAARSLLQQGPTEAFGAAYNAGLLDDKIHAELNLHGDLSAKGKFEKKVVRKNIKKNRNIYNHVNNGIHSDVKAKGQFALADAHGSAKGPGAYLSVYTNTLTTDEAAAIPSKYGDYYYKGSQADSEVVGSNYDADVYVGSSATGIGHDSYAETHAEGNVYKSNKVAGSSSSISATSKDHKGYY